MTRVKICGITNLEDARLAARLGADFLGFNFVESSTRYITPGMARSIIDNLSIPVRTVGIFANESVDRVRQFTIDSNVDVVQFHGDEPKSDLEYIRNSLGRDVIKAFRISPDFQQESVGEYLGAPILLDAYSHTSFGGTGEVADWALSKKIAASVSNVILAGGLTPENVAEAIRVVRPFGVDVASGVESSPGVKDPNKLEAFIRNAKTA